MEFKEAVKIALQSLWANKLRTILTLLGVVIGVASVIAVVTLVNGANIYVATQDQQLWRGRVHDVASCRRSSPAMRSIEPSRSGRIFCWMIIGTCEDNCKRCVGMGAHAVDDRKDRVRNAVEYGYDDSRLYVADAGLQNLNIVQGRGFTQTDDEHARRWR